MGRAVGHMVCRQGGQPEAACLTFGCLVHSCILVKLDGSFWACLGAAVLFKLRCSTTRLYSPGPCSAPAGSCVTLGVVHESFHVHARKLSVMPCATLALGVTVARNKSYLYRLCRNWLLSNSRHG